MFAFEAIVKMHAYMRRFWAWLKEIIKLIVIGGIVFLVLRRAGDFSYKQSLCPMFLFLVLYDHMLATPQGDSGRL